MNKGIKRTLWATYLVVVGLYQCHSPDKAEDPPSPGVSPQPIALTVPKNFPAPAYAFEENTLTEEGFELGRLLFYDARLSSDGTVACGSCHRQIFGFADHSHDLSHGVGSQLGMRNTPGLANIIWQPEFFWDGGVTHFEHTPLNALTNPVEMGETLQNVLQKLNNLAIYRQKFKAAFGQDTITSQLLLRAYAQFVGSMVSANSRYDHYVRKENNVQLTDNERMGLQLFQTHCAACHASDLFTDHSYRNNGLDSVFADFGRELITADPSDRGKFKVPSLRNIALTAPYMHNGRFATLQQVLNHYASGVKPSATLDPLLQQDRRLGIPLTEKEKEQIIAFLHTLTDQTLRTDKRFVDPIGNLLDR